jgi:hypothetical protein
MTYSQIVEEVQQLPDQQRLALLQVLIQSFHKPDTKDEPVIPFLQLRGVLKPDGAIPTDEEIKQEYMDYLEEKHR